MAEKEVTPLAAHDASCGWPTVFFVHFVACGRCGRKFRKDGVEVDLVPGDFAPEKYHVLNADGSKTEAW